MLRAPATPEQQLLLTGVFPLLRAAAGSGLSQVHACVPDAGGAARVWGRKWDEGCGGCLRACTPSVKFQDTVKILRQLTAKPGILV